MPHFIFIQQISVLNILNMLYNLLFFSSKCRLFHNATLFGFCITHILNTVCAKIKKKKIRGQNVKVSTDVDSWDIAYLRRNRYFRHIFQCWLQRILRYMNSVRCVRTAESRNCLCDGLFYNELVLPWHYAILLLFHAILEQPLWLLSAKLSRLFN